MKNILYILLLFPVLICAQTSTQNYVRTTTYRDSTATTNTAKAQISTTYFDGLGRPIQNVDGKASASGKDIVTHMEYDVYNRQPKNYMSYPSTSVNMGFHPQSKDSTNLYYNVLKYENTTNPYSEQFYEASPLNRVLKEASPGLPWAGSATNDIDNTVKYIYRTNTTADSVVWFGVSHPLVRSVEDTEDTNLVYKGYYQPYQLYKTITKNENWKASDLKNNTVEEFKDKEGHLILKRTYNNNDNHDTYYIYDRYNNLTYVIPPLAADQVVYNVVAVNPAGRNYPWTDLALVNKALADSYNTELKTYDNSTILNANLLDKYGGQGGFSLITDENADLSLIINVSTANPMPYRTGILTNLKSLGIFKDRELGRISGSGYSYIFTIKGNNIEVIGSGNVPSTNVTFAGTQKLDYSKNYPWTALCEGDKAIIAKYDNDIASLANSAILTTYTANSYGASGGIAASVDPDDTLTLSLNISSNTGLSFKNGAVFPLEIQRRLTDGEIGTVSGTGYNYTLSLQDNSLIITGTGTFTHINISFNQNRVAVPTIRQEVVEGLCYTYHYDYRNRMVEKRIPDNGWTYIVYDKLDRPVLTQDAALRVKGKYLFTKYDALGRVAYTGEYIEYMSRKLLQTGRNQDTGALYETRLATPLTIDNGNPSLYYSNNVFPTLNSFDFDTPIRNRNYNLYLYTINYYDDYAFGTPPANILTQNWYGTPVTKLLKGLATGSKIRTLGTNQWESVISFYDSRARPIYIDTNNDFLGSHNILQTLYHFNNLPKGTTTVHYKNNGEIRIDDAFTYDNPGRLLKHTQKINLGTEQLIAWNSYDELGQLLEKKVGGIPSTTYAFTTGLQTVNYSYNIRGWLKGINDTSATLGATTYGDLFAFAINYNTTSITGSAALYNGNIAETHWKTVNDNKVRHYSYSYDALNRLTDAKYTEATNNTIDNKYTEGSILYDKNGNIQNLNRYGFIAASQYDYIDKLVYTYMPYSNKLLKVTDDASSTLGFLNGASGTGNDYSYDTAGNMLKDLNKGIGTATTSGITYSYLNLPGKVTFTGTNKFIEYTYDANGTRLQKKVTDGSNITTTQYVNGFIYEGTTLNYFSHPEGYVDCLNNTYTYIYQYKDHLGNVRFSYKKNGSVLQKVAEDNYYAFGLKHEGYNTVVNSTNLGQKLLFGGKELNKEQGLSWYDFGARNYDAALGRWMNIDPKAESFYSETPYGYAANNPVVFVDPDGMAYDVFGNEEGGGPIGELKTSQNTVQRSSGGGNDKEKSKENSPNFLQRAWTWLTGGGNKNSIQTGPIQKVDPQSPEEQAKYRQDIQKLNANFGGIIEGMIHFICLTSGGEIGEFEQATSVIESVTVETSAFSKIGSTGQVGEEIFAEGSFSVLDWSGYPAGAAKPLGPFKLLEGAEYTAARKAANSANRALRSSNPSAYEGLQIHEIQPIKFNGSPTDIANKAFLTQQQHIQYTNYWNVLMRNIQKQP